VTGCGSFSVLFYNLTMSQASYTLLYWMWLFNGNSTEYILVGKSPPGIEKEFHKGGGGKKCFKWAKFERN
jgi:hypothetical protein